MTWYINAYIINDDVAHIHCCDLPINSTAIEIDENFIKVVAEVDGEYQDAGVVLPLLSWDGKALSGVPIISQHVETSTV